VTGMIDVLVIGAGLSGINVAYRLQERCPELSYTILERRERLGGTWDLFRYPGIRSDSDIYTLAYPFNPWRGADSIVGGGDIRDYLGQTAERFGIDRHIEYGVRVTRTDWSPDESRWHTVAAGPDGPVEYVSRFVVFCTGYYDYDRPHDPGFAGLDDFAGRVVHPQFWPGELDCRDQRVVVVGSGATAVTLVPALAAAQRGGSGHVTMLQRTPTYVLAQPKSDPIADRLRKVLPPRAAHQVIRAKNAGVAWALYQACRRWPDAMRGLIRKAAISSTGDEALVDQHFNPPYGPWEQRLCIAPRGDLYAAIRDGEADVVTGHIDRFVAEGVRLTTGEVVPADVVVTATGLQVQLAGGIDISVGGVPVDVSTSYAYYGAMLSDVPNAAVCIGYINLSWTMRSDMTARFIAKVVRRLVDTRMDVVVPRVPADIGPSRPFMDMQSGYIARAAHLMPRTTRRYPWAVRQNVLVDAWETNRADLDDGLEWSRAHDRVRA